MIGATETWLGTTEIVLHRSDDTGFQSDASAAVELKERLKETGAAEVVSTTMMVTEVEPVSGEFGEPSAE